MLVVFENVFLIGGIFNNGGQKKIFWDRENQLFWELYGPLPGRGYSGSVIQTNRQTEITTVICIVIFFKEGGGCLFPIITLYIVYIEQI